MTTDLPPDVASHPLTRAFAACSERPQTLGLLLREVTERYADRQALAWRGQAVSYSDLWTSARAVAAALVAAGCGKGTRVGILMSSRPEFIAAAYGTAMIGGVVLLLHSVATAKDRDYMLAHSDCQVLLMQAAFLRQDWARDLAGFHPEIATQTPGDLRLAALPFLRRVVCLDETPGLAGIQRWSDFIAAGAGTSGALLDAMLAQVHPSDDGVIIYTSGSTGSPKGALHRQRSACLQQWRAPIIFGTDPDERFWSLYPFFWSAGFAFFMGALTAGCCLVLQERFDAAETLELIERERITMMAAAVATLAPLADHPDVTKRDLSSIRHIPTMAGLRRHLNLAEKAWGPTAAYGLSETFANATYIIPDDVEPMTRPGGYPMPGMRFRIIDPETGRELPQGETGEIALAGTQVMRCYYKRNPEEYSDADGYIRTGDEGFIDARGRVHFTARLSNMIKTKGANVSPMEIEEKLLRWGKVKIVFVVGIPHPDNGEDVVACVVKRDDLDVTAEEIIAHLKQEVASYKVPRHVVFLQAGDIPMTATNKPKLPDLRALAQQRLRG
jgi:acyl-CoA synthetase (AMP-forming)/AMP-acid ligase II